MVGGARNGRVEAEKGNLSDAPELAWGMERKADPNTKPLRVPLISAAARGLSKKKVGAGRGLDRSRVLVNLAQRDHIRGYKCTHLAELRAGKLMSLQRRSLNPPCVRHCGRPETQSE